MADQVTNSIIVMEPQSKSVQDLVKLLQAKGNTEILTVASPEEAIQLTQQYQPCVLALSIQDNSAIPGVVTLLKKIEKSIKTGMTKTFVISKIKNRQMANLITSMGVTDYIEEPIPARTLQFKANLVIRALETIRKQQAQKNAAAEKIVFKKSAQNADPTQTAGGEGAQKTKSAPALELKEDTFLFKNSQTKKVGKKFTIEMEGPDPETGDWVQHEDKGDASNSWRWVPKKEANEPPTPADEEKDGWVHSGDKPTYNPETQKWQMTSEKPDLALMKKQKKVAQKVRTNEQGEIEIAGDSPIAEENLQKNKEIAKRKKEKKAALEKRLAGEPESADAKEKSAAKAGADGDAGDEADPDESDQSPAAIAKREKKKNKAGLDKLAALQDKLSKGLEGIPDSPEGENDADSAAASGESSASEDEEEDDSSPEGIAKREKDKAKKKLSPLDFLKKKKEENEEDGGSELKTAQKKKKRAKADGTPVEDGEDEGEEAAALAKKRKDRISAKLASLKSKMGDEAEEPGEDSSPEALEKVEKKKARGDGDEETDASASDSDADDGEEDSAPLTPEEEEARAEERKQLAKKKKDKLRKEVFQKIQEEINKPIEENLPDDLEKALRKKHKLENRPEVTAKDLAKREKADNLKQLKEKLLELDQMSEDQLLEDEEAPARNVHDLSVPERENVASQRGFLKEEGRKINAHDSVDPPEEDDEDLSVGALDKKKKLKKVLGEGAEEKYVYMKRDQIQPPGGAWEGTGDYYAYIQGEIHYHGFKVLREILPLWIYGGEAIPILLDKSQEWRFHLSLPKQVHDVKDIPEQVREYLLALRDRVKEKNAPVDAEEAAEIETLRKKKKRPEAVNSRAEEEDKDLEVENESSAEEEISGTAEKDTKKSDALKDKLAALNDKLSSEISDDTETTDLSAGKEENNSDELTLSADKDKNEKKSQDSQTAEDELEAAADAATDAVAVATEKQEEKDSESSAKDAQEESSAESKEEETSSSERKKARKETDDKLAALRDAVNEGAEALDSSSESAEKTAAEKSEDGEDLSARKDKDESSADGQDSLDATGKKQETADGAKVPELEGKLKGKSKALTDFFERRKNKDKKAAEALDTERKKTQAAAAPHEAFLGVFVALSDAVTLGAGVEKSCLKVLRAVRAAFDDCELALLAPETGAVLHSTSDELPKESTVALPDPHAYALTGKDGSEGKNLGYLYLKIAAPRESFTPSEMAVIEKSASVLWAIIAQENIGAGAERNKAA